MGLEEKSKREWTELLLQEELLWLQKSRVDWLNFGDKNMKFFHTSTLILRRTNRIEVLKDEAGEWIRDSEKLKEMAVKFYSELFAADENAGRFFPTQPFPKFGLDVARDLEKEFSMEDTQEALCRM